MTSASSRVQLDPNDPDDRKIIARQVKAAREAGRGGRDRAGSTRGRVDLEEAFDEGAAEAAAPAVPDEGAAPAAGPGRSRRGWNRFRKMGPGWSSVKPTSPARLPTRVSDAGGFLSGLALYTVVVIYIRYGPEGWKGWVAAKFLNKPMEGAVTDATGTKPKSGSGKSRLV